MLNRRTVTLLARGVPAAALAATIGCAAPVHRRDHGPVIGYQGSAYDVVLPGSRAAKADPGWEFARNDDRLGLRTATQELRRRAYPTTAVPTLDRARSIYLSRTSRRFIYFGPQIRANPVYP